MTRDQEREEGVRIARGLTFALALWVCAGMVWVIAFEWKATLLTIARAIVFVPDSVWVLALLAMIAYLVIHSLRNRLDRVDE